MQIGVIIALLFSILIALFAILNNEVVEINYLLGSAPVSIVIVILASAFLGALVVGVLSLVGRIKASLRFREYDSKFKKMEEKLEYLKEREAELMGQVSEMEKTLYGETGDTADSPEENQE